MKAAAPRVAAPTAEARAADLAGRSGLFVVHFRNRPLGREEVSIRGTGGSCVEVRATTMIDATSMTLRQSLVAQFDGRLRPLRCDLSGTLNGEPHEVSLEVRDEEVALRVRRAGVDEVRTLRPDREPLLLVDNCFVLHALAGLTAARGPADATVFESIPAGDEMKATRGPGERVLLGGHDFDPPAVTLHLAREFPEHVWIEEGWVRRLAIPMTHMIVDWRAA